MIETTHIVLVGHCGFDTGSLTRAIRRAVGDVEIASTNSSDSLERWINPDALFLVNRILDGAFSHETGVDLIRDLAGRDPSPKMMLVSNYEDAQAQAVSAGALPGFGKSSLGSAQTAARLREAVEAV